MESGLLENAERGKRNMNGGPKRDGNGTTHGPSFPSHLRFSQPFDLPFLGGVPQ